MTSNKQPNNRSFVICHVLIGQTFVEYLLFAGTGVRKMSNTQSTAPGSSYSSKWRWTPKQRASKPSGKCLAEAGVGQSSEQLH